MVKITKQITHAGKVSAEQAKQKAELEFDKFDRDRRAVEDAIATAELEQQLETLKKNMTPIRARKTKP